MTSRTAFIKRKDSKGDSEECTGPGRIVYQLQGVDCQIEEFMEWYRHSQDFQDFLLCPPDLLIDLGGNCNVLEVGQLLSVSFDEYFDGWLNTELADWRRCNQKLAIDLSITSKLEPQK